MPLPLPDACRTRPPGARRWATATFRFYARLNDFLPPHRRGRRFAHRFEGTPAALDVVQSLGVPHPEVELLLVNGASVDFQHHLGPDDDVSAYPAFSLLDVSAISLVRPEPLPEPRFVADVHLGRLARDLRLLGFDTAWRNDATDPEIAEQSRAERRLVLTRDKGLLQRRRVTHGRWIRATRPRHQLREVVDHLRLAPLATPYTRCMACNTPLVPAPPPVVAERVPPRARACHHHFRLCPGCGRVFWRGTHFRALKERVEGVLGGG